MPGISHSDPNSGTPYERPTALGVVLPGVFAAELPQTGSCHERRAVELSRGEMALLFFVSKRTIARWEVQYGLPNSRKNARVLRYAEDAVIHLLVLGFSFDRNLAERLGLHTKALIDRAPHFRNPLAASAGGPSENAMLTDGKEAMARNQEELQILKLLRDSQHGKYLRAFVQSISSSASDGKKA